MSTDDCLNVLLHVLHIPGTKIDWVANDLGLSDSLQLQMS